MWSNLVFPLVHLNILISNVVQPDLPSCPSQHPHFWCDPTWSSLLSISTSSFLMWSNLVFPLLHLNILISDVVQPGLPSCPSQHPHFWCGPTWSSLLSISTSSFLMWSNLVFPLLHLNFLISDVVQPGLPSCPSQHPHFWCSPTWSSLLSISTSSFLMWSNLVFPLVHLNILISNVVQPDLPSCPSQHPHFWCDPTWSSLLSISTSSFLMWSNLVFPLLHLNILISDVVQPGLPSCPSQHPHFWCDPTWSSLLSISTSSFRLNLACSYFRPNIQNCIIASWSDDCFEDFVFQFHGHHHNIAHYPGYFLPLHPPDSYPVLLTSACEPPSFVNSEPMYLKDVTRRDNLYPSIFTFFQVCFVYAMLTQSRCLYSSTWYIENT